MILPLLVSLSLSASLAELKLDPHSYETTIIENLTDGFGYVPLSRYSTRVMNLVELPGDARAALTREALESIKTYVMSDQGREAWTKRVARPPSQPFAERAASVASNVTYFATLVKESRTKDENFVAALERAHLRAAAFKRERAQLQREELSREKATAQPDDAAFKLQIKERLTLFLGETKAMPWSTALVEKKGHKVFVDATLEGKPNWWKLCFRAGPEATGAARDFAMSWLAELNAPPSKLSDEK